MGTKKAGSPRAGTYLKTTLRNGLRVLSERIPSVRSISIGVWVDVGSRNEALDENGLSHFVEHLVFKGTKSRNARQVAQALESIGGTINAFTTRENTCFTARVLDEHLAEALDVLADITCHATLTQTNMDRERQVICEEIKESLDNPADHIHDLFSSAFWGDHPLGRPIMGPEATIQKVTRPRLKQYMRRHYRTGSIVVAASGSVSHRRLHDLVRKSFDFETGVAEQPLQADRSKSKRFQLVENDASQTQFCVGWPGVGYTDRHKLTAVLMATYLGGGMSSVLFQKIREQRGLAYSVFAFHDFYRDSGIFGVYLGTDKLHLGEAFEVITKEAQRMKQRKISAKDLHQVKEQMKGHLTLGMESTSARMHRLGRQELILGTVESLDQTIKAIDRITATDVVELANMIFDPTQQTAAVLGPCDREQFSGLIGK